MTAGWPHNAKSRKFPRSSDMTAWVKTGHLTTALPQVMKSMHFGMNLSLFKFLYNKRR